MKNIYQLKQYNCRSNEVTIQKEKQANNTIDYDKVLEPMNSTFDISSYFSGVDLKAGTYKNPFIHKVDYFESN